MSTPIRYCNDAGVEGETTLEHITEGLSPWMRNAVRTAMAVPVGYLPHPHPSLHAPRATTMAEAVRQYLEATRASR